LQYLVEYEVSHLGKKHTGNVLVPGKRVPKVGDIANLRIEDEMMPARVDRVEMGMGSYGIQHLKIICSTRETDQSC
jgi:hypothetical protein